MDTVGRLAFTICKNTRHPALDIPANLVAAYIYFISVYEMLHQLEILSQILAHLLLFSRRGKRNSFIQGKADTTVQRTNQKTRPLLGSSTEGCIQSQDHGNHVVGRPAKGHAVWVAS